MKEADSWRIKNMAKNFEDMGLIEMAKTLGNMGKELKASGYGECHACYGEPQYHDINTCKCRCHCRACLNGFVCYDSH